MTTDATSPGPAGDYDGIILGAGHNALILASYLGQAGLRILAVDRGSGRRRRSRHARIPAPVRLSAQPARVLPAGGHRHAVVRGSRSRTPRRTLHRAGAQRRAAHPRRPRARMVDGHRHAPSRRSREFSRRDAETLRRWHDEFVPIAADILMPGESLAAAAAGRAPAAARTHAGGPPAARGERPVAARVRAAGVRAPDGDGRPVVLQRAARGRHAGARLRPPYRRADRQSGEGADVARRQRGSRARAGVRHARAAAGTSGC